MVLEVFPLTAAFPDFAIEPSLRPGTSRSFSPGAPFGTEGSSFCAKVALVLLEDLRNSLIICGLRRGCSGERVAYVVIDAVERIRFNLGEMGFSGAYSANK